jgi:hypothetical protein
MNLIWNEVRTDSFIYQMKPVITLPNRVGYFMLILHLFVGLGAITGCTTGHKVFMIGSGFGLQYHGSPLPHSPTYVSLLHTNSGGKWITVWQAISFRFEGTSVSNDAIVFGGVTHHGQAEQGLVRFLYFSESTGIVDLTDSLAEKGQVAKNINLRWITVKQNSSSLNIGLQSVNSGDFSVQVTFEQLAEMARAVVGQNRKGTFDGIDFFE